MSNVKTIEIIYDFDLSEELKGLLAKRLKYCTSYWRVGQALSVLFGNDKEIISLSADQRVKFPGGVLVMTVQAETNIGVFVNEKTGICYVVE